jgi:2-keto-4-pentenoate hydratase
MIPSPPADARIDAAARALLAVPHVGPLLDGLPERLRPLSRTEAYAVQTRVAELRAQDTVGWKIAATSIAGQRHINVAGPLAGRILRDRLVDDPSAISLAGNAMCLAEIEFVFVLGAALAPRDRAYTRAEVRDAVGTVHLGVELPDTRYSTVTEVGELQLIADNACSHQFLLGPEASPLWERLPLDECPVAGTVTGPSGTRSAEGSGANVLGHPLEALTWLVNELSAQGVPLQPGQFVTTGTCCTPIPLEPGDTLTATWGALGTTTCSFVA